MVGGVKIWQWRSDGTFFYTELSGLDMIEKLITALSQEVGMSFQLVEQQDEESLIKVLLKYLSSKEDR